MFFTMNSILIVICVPVTVYYFIVCINSTIKTYFNNINLLEKNKEKDKGQNMNYYATYVMV